MGSNHHFLPLVLVISVLFGAHAEARKPQFPGILLKDQSIVIQDHERTYDLYVPTKLGTSPRPLVLLLHGHIGNADVMTGENRKAAPYKVWLDIAEREKLLVLIPDGVEGSKGHRGWNDCRADATSNPTLDDVAFIDTLLNSLSKAYPVDASRLYVTGTSNGGGMTYRLAIERSDRFAAAAPIVAALPKNSECKAAPDKPISILIMNGTRDPLLPYTGGQTGNSKSERGESLSTRESVRYWVQQNGCNTLPEVHDLADKNEKDNSRIHVEHFGKCRDGVDVFLYEVRGGGHTEPSLSEHYRRLYKRIVGPQNRDIEMADEVWAFFRNRQRQAD